MRKTSETMYIHGLQKLIWLSEVNIALANEIYVELEASDRNANRFLLLSANNAVYESVGIMHTLLCSTKKEELTIKPALEKVIASNTKTGEKSLLQQFEERIEKDYPNPDYMAYTFLNTDGKRLIGDLVRDIKLCKLETALADLEDLKNDFVEANFHKIRHQLGAHKNKFQSDPAGAADLFIIDELREKLQSQVRKLRIHAYYWFGYELKNPYYSAIEDMKKFTSQND